MEGVRRILISLDNEQIYRIRAPVFFKDLKSVLQKLCLPVNDSIRVTYQNRKESISNEEKYSKCLEKCGFKGLSINFDTPDIDSNTVSTSPNRKPKQQKLPNKRQRSKTPTPSKTPQKTLQKTTPQKTTPQKSSTKSTPSRSSPRKHSKTSETPPKPSSNPSKSPKRSNKSTPSPKKTHSPKLEPKLSPSPKHPTPSPPKPLTNSSPRPKSPSKPSPSAFTISPIPSSTFIFATQPATSLFNTSSSFLSTTQANIDLQISFHNVPDEGKLKLIDSTTEKSRLISELNIKKSSRLLLTPDGILVTGGSGVPYQAMMIKSDYSITPLVSMNNPRFWHCMGYIDGCPAVAAGAERSKIPKVFLNTVEIYKNGSWVNYPSLNIHRASTCMSWNDSSAYVIGGVLTTGSINAVTDQIEKFQDGVWLILSVKLPISLLSCGSFPISEKKIQVFGGETSGGNLVSQNFVLDVENGNQETGKSLPYSTKFTYGQQVRFVGGFAVVCDYSGRVLKIETTNTQS